MQHWRCNRRNVRFRPIADIAPRSVADHAALMDFMKWLNSLDELLYEVMSWLLFFPVTFWRALRFPIASMKEIERQASLPENQQYSRLISPPLFLTLGLLLAHGIGVALGQTDTLVAKRSGLAGLINDDTSALILRVIVFASFALFLAARMVRCSGRELDRQTLRLPFYEQCYPTTVFAVSLTIGTCLASVPKGNVSHVGAALIVLSFANFFGVEVYWFARSLGIGLLRGLAHVLVALAQGSVFLIIVGSLMFG